MTARLAARLATSGAFTTRSFELRDLAASVHALAPERVVIDFMQGADGAAALHLDCRFDEAPAAERALHLKERLLRADFAGRYDCVFVDARDAATPALAIGVLGPEDAQLPGGQWLSLPVPLADAAIDVFRHAQANGFEIGYRVDLTARTADPGLARKLVPALAALATRNRQPDAEASLREAIDMVSSDGWSAEESFLLPHEGEHAHWLGRLVMRRLRAAMPFVPNDFWAVTRARAEGGTPSPAARVERARKEDYVDRLLETITPSRNENATALPPRRMPPAVDGDYVFISYAHADRAYAEKVIERLQQAGVRVWFDAGIQPGAVWDEALESRIRLAGAVVVCLTSRYEQSRYCTRELKFADLLAKPILPIAPVPWAWGSGLQLMFQELQVACFDQGHGFNALRDALQATSPKVFG